MEGSGYTYPKPELELEIKKKKRSTAVTCFFAPARLSPWLVAARFLLAGWLWRGSECSQRLLDAGKLRNLWQHDGRRASSSTTSAVVMYEAGADATVVEHPSSAGTSDEDRGSCLACDKEYDLTLTSSCCAGRSRAAWPSRRASSRWTTRPRTRIASTQVPAAAASCGSQSGEMRAASDRWEDAELAQSSHRAAATKKQTRISVPPLYLALATS
jgi:hypothetical protein